MALPVTIPNTFANATAAIPLSQLDANFNTLSNAVNGLNSGSETLANLKATTANVVTLTVTGNATIGDASTDTVTLNSTLTANTAVIFSAGTSAAPSITFAGDTNTGIFSPAADTIAFTEGGVESMRIDSSGNVGIGTTSPNKGSVSRAVTLNGTAGNIVEFCVSDTRVGWVYGDNNLTAVAAAGSRYLSLETNGSERMRIDTSGNVGIGTTSPSEKLDVAGIVQSKAAGNNARFSTIDTNGSGATVLLNAAFAGAGTPALQVTTNHPLLFCTNNTERARIDSSGNFFVNNMAVGGTANLHWSSGAGQFFVTSSSRRFKHDIVDYDKGLAELMQMQPKYFVYNDEPNQKQRAGFIAEDFHDLGMTEYVEYWKDDEGNDTPSEIGYSNMVAILVKAIQEQQALITTLTDRITALETPTGTQA